VEIVRIKSLNLFMHPLWSYVSLKKCWAYDTLNIPKRHLIMIVLLEGILIKNYLIEVNIEKSPWIA